MSRIELVDGPDAGMSWHYGDPLGEQRRLEAGAAAVRLASREIFTISGAERLSWLHSLTSQALDGLTPGVGADALVLSPTGQIEFGLAVSDDGTQTWCWTEPGVREPLLAWLESMKFWTEVELVARDDVVLWWVGSQLELSAAALAQRPSPIAGGRELWLPVDAEVAVEQAGQWAHEALRIAAGVPRIGLDTDHRTLPNEIGLFGTALEKGCYRGQETVARVHNLGRPPRRLVRLLFDGELPATGAEISHAGRVVGALGTTAQHHELGPIGLAIIKRSVPVDAELEVAGIAASQDALVDPEVGVHFRPTL